MLKTFLNNEKIPCILTLLHQDKFVIDFKEKTNIFNSTSVLLSEITVKLQRAPGFHTWTTVIFDLH